MQGRVVWSNLSFVIVICPFCKVPELHRMHKEESYESICKKGFYRLGGGASGILRWLPGVDYTGKPDPPMWPTD